MGYKETLTIIGILCVMTAAINAIFFFLGVQFAMYGNYLFWIWMLVIFYLVLPDQVKSKLV